MFAIVTVTVKRQKQTYVEISQREIDKRMREEQKYMSSRDNNEFLMMEKCEMRMSLGIELLSWAVPVIVSVEGFLSLLKGI